VIVRGKAGAEVEFGNLLILGEQKDGLIIDWELFVGKLACPNIELAQEQASSGISIALIKIEPPMLS
jgi:hypothetical protein